MLLLISAGMPTLPFVTCGKEKTLGQLAETRLSRDHSQLLGWAGACLSSGCIRLVSAAMQADWLYPKALTNNIKLGFPPPIFDNERQSV